MAYHRVTWEDGQTALSADNMNNIEQGINEALVQAQGNTDMWAYIRNLVYPVGSIYMSATLSTKEAVEDLLGGTWVAWGAGKVPVGVNTSDTSFNTVEKTGGSKDAIIPSHNHTATFSGTALAKHTHTFTGTAVASHTHSYSAAAANTGGSTLSVADLAVHSHPLKLSTTTRAVATSSGGGTVDAITSVSVIAAAGSSTGSAGGGGTHNHSIGTTSAATGSAGGHTPAGTNAQVSAGTPAGSVTVASNGVAVTNKNLQPYITCYMWKRTA